MVARKVVVKDVAVVIVFAIHADVAREEKAVDVAVVKREKIDTVANAMQIHVFADLLEIVDVGDVDVGYAALGEVSALLNVTRTLINT